MTSISSTILYYALPILGLVITSAAQLFIKINYGKYKKVNSNSRKSGREVARMILDKKYRCR